MDNFNLNGDTVASGNSYISLASLFSIIGKDGAILVAVSGGGDSIALLHLANAWAIQQSREILAVTVDHGLRAESMAEATFVANVCDQLNVTHAILGWEGVKPTAGISEAARNARYQLIEEFAKDIGVDIILSGHTADDQAETIQMRLERTSSGNGETGGRGLAGMCRKTRLAGGSELVRPLLGVSRQKLRNYLKEISQSWIEDPSNFDTSFERVRIREKLNGNEHLTDKLLRYGQAMGRYRQCQCENAAQLLAQCVEVKNGQVFQVNLTKLNLAAQPVAQLMLRTVIAIAGGGRYMASETQISKLLRQMGNTGGDIITKARTTLGRSVIERRKNYLLIYREVRDIKPCVIEAGERVVWDGRVQILNTSSHPIEVAALEPDRCANLEDALGSKFDVTPRAALGSLPVVTTNNGSNNVLLLHEVSMMADIEYNICSRAIEAFCPQWDYGLVEWIKNLDFTVQKRASLH